MNNVSLIGRLTGDPRIIETRMGKMVAHFNLAINGQRGNTVFVQITAWDQCCTTAQKYLSKGYQVGISGRLATSHNGELEVVANSITLIEKKDATPREEQAEQAGPMNDSDLLDELDEFPM